MGTPVVAMAELAAEHGWSVGFEPLDVEECNAARIVVAVKAEQGETVAVAVAFGRSAITGRWSMLVDDDGYRTTVVNEQTGQTWRWKGGAWRDLLVSDVHEIIELCPGWGVPTLRLLGGEAS